MSNATPHYFRLRVVGLSRPNEDEFTNACFVAGAAGVAEDLRFTQSDLRYEPDVIATPDLDLNVYFETAPGESDLLALQGRFPEIKLELVSEENRDWLAEWKKGFKPFLFSHPFWVVPSWLQPPPEAPSDPSKIIFVEPGMAFGTGTHETTRLAADLIIEEMVIRPATNLLDVGTGTGILALVARRLGASHVVGIDNDPEARRTARENLELNRASEISIPDLNLEDTKDSYDLVIANIIDGVLTLLRHELNRVLRPGGRMVLSGILAEREAVFLKYFCDETGLRLLKQTADGEWVAALLEKPSDISVGTH